MNFEEFYNYCLQKKGVVESFPFDDKTLSFKIGGKIFAITDVIDFNSVNLKCDPQKSYDLRERYIGIHPGYHMNKKHWNTVMINEDIDDQLLRSLIDESYLLVFNSLSKKSRDEIKMG